MTYAIFLVAILLLAAVFYALGAHRADRERLILAADVANSDEQLKATRERLASLRYATVEVVRTLPGHEGDLAFDVDPELVRRAIVSLIEREKAARLEVEDIRADVRLVLDALLPDQAQALADVLEPLAVRRASPPPEGGSR